MRETGVPASRYRSERSAQPIALSTAITTAGSGDAFTRDGEHCDRPPWSWNTDEPERSRAVLYELPPLPYRYGALEPHVDYLEAWRNVVNWPRAVEPLAGAGGRHAATV
jgi:hypothetical protein